MSSKKQTKGGRRIIEEEQEAPVPVMDPNEPKFELDEDGNEFPSFNTGVEVGQKTNFRAKNKPTKGWGDLESEEEVMPEEVPVEVVPEEKPEKKATGWAQFAASKKKDEKPQANIEIEEFPDLDPEAQAEYIKKQKEKERERETQAAAKAAASQKRFTNTKLQGANPDPFFISEEEKQARLAKSGETLPANTGTSSPPKPKFVVGGGATEPKTASPPLKTSPAAPPKFKNSAISDQKTDPFYISPEEKAKLLESEASKEVVPPKPVAKEEESGLKESRPEPTPFMNFRATAAPSEKLPSPETEKKAEPAPVKRFINTKKPEPNNDLIMTEEQKKQLQETLAQRERENQLAKEKREQEIAARKAAAAHKIQGSFKKPGEEAGVKVEGAAQEKPAPAPGVRVPIYNPPVSKEENKTTAPDPTPNKVNASQPKPQNNTSTSAPVQEKKEEPTKKSGTIVKAKVTMQRVVILRKL